jgi:hydrogenase maturation protease
LLILCCGNADRGDDGAGPACADALRLLGTPARCLPGDAFTLLDAWKGHDKVVIVDAVVTGDTPGAVQRFLVDHGKGIEGFESKLGTSTHGFGVAEAFRLGLITRNFPAEAVIYGIEAASFEWGAGLSNEVHEAVQKLATALAREHALQRGTAARGQGHHLAVGS